MEHTFNSHVQFETNPHNLKTKNLLFICGNSQRFCSDSFGFDLFLFWAVVKAYATLSMLWTGQRTVMQCNVMNELSFYTALHVLFCCRSFSITDCLKMLGVIPNDAQPGLQCGHFIVLFKCISKFLHSCTEDPLCQGHVWLYNINKWLSNDTS